MEEESIQPFANFPSGDEQRAEYSLRPSTFAEFVGQKNVVDNLLIAIEAARERQEVLDHVLLSGMPGLGKTTLCHLISKALAADLHTLSGPNLEHPRDFVGILTSLKRGSVLFIDEIHRISKVAEEYLYTAMEDYQVDIVVDKGVEARTYRLPLQPFTLVGATTMEGLLSAPFRSRFGIQEKLEPYSVEDLIAILRRSARLLSLEIQEDAAGELARRARGTPRYANRFLRRIRDIAQMHHRRRPQEALERRTRNASLLRIDLRAVEEGLERLGVDANGLDRIDRRILHLLAENPDRPIGLKTIAISIGEAERTIEDVYEPHLLRLGLIIKTPRGRLASAKALELVGSSLS